MKTVFSGSNTTHVNVTVSWKSPGGNISGYMIYYQTEAGGERETHSLDGLQRGVTYNISILALSQHLPSPLVGPVSVNTSEIHTLFVVPFLFFQHSLGVQLVVKISRQSLPVGNHNNSLTCTVRVEVNGEINCQPITIHWTVHNGTITEPRMLKNCTTREVTAPIREVTAPISCNVNINKTGGAIYYRCTAKYLGLSKFSDITVNQEGQVKLYFSYLEIYVLLFTFTGFSPLSHSKHQQNLHFYSRNFKPSEYFGSHHHYP